MKKIATIGMALVFLAACGPSTKVTSSWKSQDANAASRALNKVMIAGLISDRDRALKEQIEQQLSSSLSTEGYRVTTATTEFGPKSFEGLKENQALRRLRNSGVSGVMTITLLDKDQEKNYVPGSVNYYPVGMGYSRFWGYYRTYYNRVYTPGYYTNTTKYFFETNLYDLKTNKLIYSAQSETFDPSSASSLASDYAKAIVKDLKQKQLLQTNASK